RLARVAVVPAEPLALDDLADALARHRARIAHVHAAVRLGTAAETVALDRAREAAALHRADDVDEIARLEHGAEHGVADLHGRRRLEAFLAQVALGGDAVLLECAEARLGAALVADVAEAELHGVVAVALAGSDLRHHARTDFDHGHSRDRAVLSEQLSHSALAS